MLNPHHDHPHVPKRFLILISIWVVLMICFFSYSLASLMPNYLQAAVINTVITSLKGNLTTNTIPIGPHTLTITGTTVGGTPVSASQSFSVVAAVAPIISNVKVVPSRTSATFTFTTNEPATTIVNYGKTAAYGSIKTKTGLVVSHSISVSALSRNTTYHFQLKSANKLAKQATTADATFQTLP